MAEKQRLGLLFECHRFVFNLDIGSITRIVLSEELKELTSQSGTRVVEVGGEAYASFNLGRLLGLAPTIGAGVLVSSGGTLRFCLETGPCLLVRTPPRMIPLGPGLFRARRQAGGQQPAADEHQIALPGRQDRLVPVDQVKRAAGRQQQVAGVQVAMADNGRQRP